MKSRPGVSPRLWWEAARPRTLPAAIAPVLVATALAFHDGRWDPLAAGICLTFAILIQIGTNYANDYFDFKKGADTAERVGPRRAVAAGLIAPETMKRATGGVFTLAFLVGLSLLPFGGWPLLVVGLTSIGCGVLYTGGPYPLAYHGWGDVFVFIFFGLVAVTATYFVQAGEITAHAWWLGAGIGALSTNILVVNNYRDIETDRVANKRTLVVRWGREFARAQFVVGHGLSMLVVIELMRAESFGILIAAVILVYLLGEAVMQYRVLRSSSSAAELIQLLGRTGRHVALTALWLSLALVF